MPAAPGPLQSAVSLLLCVPLLAGCASALPQPQTVEWSATREIDELAAALTREAGSPRERAVEIFLFVRDEIEYGFTGRFDAAEPSETLRLARGHCNPKTELFVALLESAGIEARQRFVTISSDVLYGLFPKRAPVPATLDHSYAEVKIDGEWLQVDGHVPDAALFRAAVRRLESEGRSVGYGAHVDGCIAWDGTVDCMAQFVDPGMLITDHPVYEPARAFYRSGGYGQRLGPVSGFFYRVFGVGALNRSLAKMRAADPAENGP